MRALALPLLLLLTACDGGRSDTPEIPANTGDPGTTGSTGAVLDPNYAAPPSLVGEYRVAGVDDVSVELGWAMTVSIDENTIRLASQCVTPEWTYRWDGKALAIQPVQTPICERGRAPEEEAAIAALDSATRVERTPENGLRFDGGEHSITLFSQ